MNVPSDPHPDTTLCTCGSTSVLFCVVNMPDELSLHYLCPRTISIVIIKLLPERKFYREEDFLCSWITSITHVVPGTQWGFRSHLLKECDSSLSSGTDLFPEYTVWKVWEKLSEKLPHTRDWRQHPSPVCALPSYDESNSLSLWSPPPPIIISV